MTDKVPANVRKMELAIQSMQEAILENKKTIQQMEKQFSQFKKFAESFIEHSKKANEKKPRKPSGFVLPVSVSPELCRFLNISEGSEISRTEVTRYIIQYIQERNLVHPEKKTMVVPDEALGELLGPDVDLDTLTRFTIQKYMNKHFL